MYQNVGDDTSIRRNRGLLFAFFYFYFFIFCFLLFFSFQYMCDMKMLSSIKNEICTCSEAISTSYFQHLVLNYVLVRLCSTRSRNLRNPRIALRNAMYRNPYFGAQSKDCAPYSRIAHMICSPACAQSWNTVSERWTSKNRCLRSSAKILLWMVTAKY